MAGPPSARWRPPSGRRSLAYYRWTAWSRLVLAALFVVMTVVGLVRGGSNVLVSVLLLFVAVFIGSTEIWRLQGIHAIDRERHDPGGPADG